MQHSSSKRGLNIFPVKHKLQCGPNLSAGSGNDSDDSSSVITDTGSTSTENNSEVDSLDVVLGHHSTSLSYTPLSADPDTPDQVITLRPYQEELLRLARDGRNVAIFLPTGTGKTFIVLKLIQVK